MTQNLVLIYGHSYIGNAVNILLCMESLEYAYIEDSFESKSMIARFLTDV